MATVNISLPDKMKTEIDLAIESEGYGNTSEFFRDLVRNYLKDKRRAHLEEMLIEGIESGDPQPFTFETLVGLRKRALERLKGPNSK